MFDDIKRAGIPVALSLSLLSGCSFSDGTRSENAERPAATSYQDLGNGVFVIEGGLGDKYEQNLSKFRN